MIYNITLPDYYCLVICMYPSFYNEELPLIFNHLPTWLYISCYWLIYWSDADIYHIEKIDGLLKEVYQIFSIIYLITIAWLFVDGVTFTAKLSRYNTLNYFNSSMNKHESFGVYWMHNKSAHCSLSSF